MESSLSKTIEERTLRNGLKVRFKDESHPVAGGRWQAALAISLTVEVLPEYFKDLPDPEGAYSSFTSVHGQCLEFRQLKVRNFVAAEEKDDLISTMKDEFLATGTAYLENPAFPSKYVLKSYNEWLEKNAWESSYRQALDRSWGE